jgi:hypothetical protein
VRAAFVEPPFEERQPAQHPLHHAVLLALGLAFQIAARPLDPADGDRELTPLELDVGEQHGDASGAFPLLCPLVGGNRLLER